MTKTLIQYLTDVLQPIDDTAKQAYEQAMTSMVASVNEVMSKREDIVDLIGPNALEVMYGNHLNHVNFMVSLFGVKSAETLAKTIVWVYQSYMSRGFSPNYFPIELKAWQHAVDQYLAPAHATIINALYQTLIEHHRDFLFLSKSQASSPYDTTIEAPLLGYFQRYLDALLAPNMNNAINVSKEYIETVWEIPIWWENIIMPSMYEIGRLWSNGKITVGQEHMATSITQRVISLHYPKILELPRNKGTVIVGVSPEELHEIGARMVADMLEMHGWDVHYTGANTPSDDLAELIHTLDAQFLCISTTIPSHLPQVQNIIKNVRSKTKEKKVHVLVGGQAYMIDPELWKTVGADGFVINASQSVEYLQKHSISSDNSIN